MNTLIVKQFRFEAAHRLPNHDGHCSRPHGHSYLVEVACRGEPIQDPLSPKHGMVIDFGDLSELWKTHLHPILDHRDLNETVGPVIGVTTAENIAKFIYEEFLRHTWGNVAAEADLVIDPQTEPLVRGVRVWETTTGYAQVGRW